METKDVGKIIKAIVEKITHNNFADLFNEDYSPHYSILDLQNAINNHPEKIVEPIDSNLYLDFNFYYIDDNHWHIDFDLYTLNNERADLTLKLILRDNDDGSFSYSITGIRTM